MKNHPLRVALRAGLRPLVDDSTALQERVLAQWHQRHPQAELALAGGGRMRHPVRVALVAATLLVVLALGAWWLRPDPALQELMQPDVLSQIGLGEL